MSERRAWIGFWVAVVLVAVTFALWSGSSDRLSRLEAEPLLSLASVAVAFSAAGAVAWRTQRRIGNLLLVSGVTSAISLLGYEYGRFALLERGGNLPLGWIAAVIGWTMWAPGFALVVGLLPHVFPDGRLLSRRWKFVPPLVGVGLVLALFGSAAAALLATEADLFTAETPSGSAGNVVVVADIGRLLLLLCGLLGLGSLTLRYVRAERATRQQLLWLVVGVAVMVPLIAAASVLESGWVVAETLGVAAIPASIAVEIRRHQLWDVQRLVSRATVYLGMSALVGLAYLLVVAAGTLVFDTRSSAGAGVIAAVAVAIVFQPARDVIQGRIERFVYGSRRDPASAMAALRQGAQLGATRQELLTSVAKTLRNELRLGYVAISVEGEPMAYDAGQETPGVELPMTVDGQRVGALTVAASPGDRITPEDQKVVEAIASQTALLVLASGLIEQLQESREQMVLAREDERRRLRRDLHDGLGPALAGIALQASAAKEFSTTDPDRSDALLDRVAEEANETMGEIRRLVQGLGPTSLDELGLVGAVERFASSLRNAGANSLDVSVRVSGSLDELPAAVEIAAYRIATEAIANVHRHAGASKCEVRFSPGDPLGIEISDDGHGIRHTGTKGVGLASMRERVAELNGTLAVDSGIDGTRVHARIPVT